VIRRPRSSCRGLIVLLVVLVACSPAHRAARTTPQSPATDPGFPTVIGDHTRWHRDARMEPRRPGSTARCGQTLGRARRSESSRSETGLTL
jgi:hypothetical protein